MYVLTKHVFLFCFFFSFQVHICPSGWFTSWCFPEASLHCTGVWVCVFLAWLPWLPAVLGTAELGRGVSGERICTPLLLSPSSSCYCEFTQTFTCNCHCFIERYKITLKISKKHSIIWYFGLDLGQLSDTSDAEAWFGSYLCLLHCISHSVQSLLSGWDPCR